VQVSMRVYCAMVRSPRNNKLSPEPPARTEYAAWLTSSLQTYEKLAKTLVDHRAEKGRIVESVVKSALRVILPGRFSIGTGFAITASGKSTSQLDIVIYDGLFNAPIALEGGIGLFPIECIYGFIEVKTRLDQKTTIEKVTRAIASVREFANEKRYVAYGEYEESPGKKVVGEHEVSNPLSPRSFVLAFNSVYADIRRLEAKLKECTEKNDAHVHALAVLENDWLIRQWPHRNPHEFICEEGQAFAKFCAAVLETIQSIPVAPASMKRYLGQ
jgi:hypothetical protein